MGVPLANVDAAWLRMDDPTNLMVVTGVMVLAAPVSVGQVKQWLEARFIKFPRFTQRIVEPPTGVGVPSWEPDPQFSIDNHLFELELPPPGDDRALQGLVSSLMSQPLNTAQPLWHFYLVPHYQGGSALIGRIHHCIGDGLALIYVMLSLADGGPEAPPAPADTHDNHGSFWDTLAQSLAGSASIAATLPAAVLREANALLGDPERMSETAGRMAATVGALGKLLLTPPDPHTVLKGPLVAEKRVVWSAPTPLTELKRIGRITGSTVNDIMTSAMTGALRRYLLGRGDVPPDLSIRGVVPVNLRPVEEAHQLGNQFGLVFLSLPVGIADPLDRLFEVRRRMNAIKDSPEAFVAFQILRAMGLAPKQVFDVALNVFGAKATAVVTNVVGPRDTISMMGVPMRQTMFWVPSAGRLGLGISLLSYAGNVWMGVQTDAGLIPDPERIMDGFRAEVEALLELEREAGH
jgi:WS/DGAT/MGAT family acyltransferase